MKSHTAGSGAQDIDEVIAQARKLVAQARKTMEESQRQLARLGFDSDSCVEELRRIGGEAAVQEAQAQVDEALRAIEDEDQRVRKASTVSKPVMKRLARRI